MRNNGRPGASVYSRMARKREDVGHATVIGFLSVLGVFALVKLVSFGVMPQSELAGMSQPSMAAVLESIVGHWGSIFIRVGVIVSVLGAYLAWTLMAAEVLYIPATLTACRNSWRTQTDMAHRCRPSSWPPD